MRITVTRLKRLIAEALLNESDCPLCGSQGAYVGLSDVECPNPGCSAFSQRQATDAMPAATTAKKTPGKPAPSQNKSVMTVNRRVAHRMRPSVYKIALPDGTTKTYDMWDIIKDLLRTEGYDDNQIDELFDMNADSGTGRAADLDDQVTREIIRNHNVGSVIDFEGLGTNEPMTADEWLTLEPLHDAWD